jgi:hypothetical protein
MRIYWDKHMGELIQSYNVIRNCERVGACVPSLDRSGTVLQYAVCSMHVRLHALTCTTVRGSTTLYIHAIYHIQYQYQVLYCALFQTLETSWKVRQYVANRE